MPQSPGHSDSDRACPRSERRIEGIVFDVDGTLYHALPLRLGMTALLAAAMLTNPLTMMEKLKIIRCFRKAQEVLRSAGTASSGSCDRQILLAAKMAAVSSEMVTDVVSEWFYKRPLPLLPRCRRRGLQEVFRRLQGQGLTLGVFSDYPAEEKIEALGIAQWVSVLVSSCDPDVSGFKPHSTGFVTAAKKMGIDPERILYVGDRPEVDGKGAAAAGMEVAILDRGGLFSRDHSYPAVNSLKEIVEVVNRHG
ncbi:MAG: HAD family hydrolase [Desulfobacteraceae bacterium]|nr:HAD family hydrolase [Desulfobacteraceae bacterium]